MSSPRGYTLKEMYAKLDALEAERRRYWHRRLLYAIRSLYYRWREDWTPREIFYRLKWFWQRGRRGYSDRDTWSFDYYLSGVIAGGVRHLRDNNHGHPCSSELCPVEAFSEECTSDCDSDGVMAKWRSLLSEMAEGFQIHADSDEFEDWPQTKLKRSLDLFSKWYTALWD